jgi:hypothetical protein
VACSSAITVCSGTELSAAHTQSGKRSSTKTVWRRNHFFIKQIQISFLLNPPCCDVRHEYSKPFPINNRQNQAIGDNCKMAETEFLLQLEG